MLFLFFWVQTLLIVENTEGGGLILTTLRKFELS
jgi:hypothetical protein